MNKVFLAQLKASLKFLFKRPLFYIAAILFALFIPGNFYLKQQFFGGTGSSDLILLFSAVPYISIILIPVLCFRPQESVYEAFIPLKRFYKNLIRFISVLCCYSAILLLTIPSALFVNLFGSIDAGQLLISYLCLVLYGAVSISLCLFLDELISNSVVSLFVSAIILGIVNSAHLISLYTNAKGFLSSFGKAISFAWHFDAASKGIIDTRDLTFFVFATLFFLIITSFTKELKAGHKFRKIDFYSNAIAKLLICVLLIFNGNRFYKRIDFSKNKTYTISSYSKTLLQNLNAPLKITYYRSGSLSRLYPQIRDISDYLSSFSQQNKNISFTVVNPEKDENIGELLQNYGITGQQLRNVNTNSTEFITVYSSIILEYEGSHEEIPFLLSSETLEYDLDRNLKSLITHKNPTVNIIVGNGMNLNGDYYYLSAWMASQGFEINNIELEDPDFYEKLNSASGILYVIGDSEINVEKAIAIENYILQQKGSGFFNVSPYSVAINSDWKMTQNQHTNVVEMLENWGFTFTEKIAGDISCAQISFYSEDDTTEVVNYPLWISLMPQSYCTQGATVFWPTPLVIQQDSDYNVKPYLISSNASFSLPIDRNSKEKLIETDPFVLRTVNTSSYEKSTQILGVRITGELNGLYNADSCDTSNIVVIPDQYFANSLMSGYIGGENGDYRNYDLITNIFWNLNDDSELAELHSKTNRDTSLYKITDAEKFVKDRNLTFGILFVLIPILILFCFISVKIFVLKKYKDLINEK